MLSLLPHPPAVHINTYSHSHTHILMQLYMYGRRVAFHSRSSDGQLVVINLAREKIWLQNAHKGLTVNRFLCYPHKRMPAVNCRSTSKSTSQPASCFTFLSAHTYTHISRRSWHLAFRRSARILPMICIQPLSLCRLFILHYLLQLLLLACKLLQNSFNSLKLALRHIYIHTYIRTTSFSHEWRM